VSEHRQGRHAEAAETYRRVIAARPEFAEAHYNFGAVSMRLGRLDEALGGFRRATEIRPDLVQAHVDLGVAWAAAGSLGEAADSYRRAIALAPDHHVAHNNLGNVLKALGQPEEAAACYRRAIAVREDVPALHCNLANTLRALGRTDEAVACYRQAIALQPDYGDARFGLAMTLLGRGDLAAGFEAYEWRWQTPQAIAAQRGLDRPQWRGEPAAGKTLLIHVEGGFGDTLQFCRYATLAAVRGLRVVLEAQAPLLRLLQSLDGVDRLVPHGEAPGDFDLHCPMLSLPFAFGTTLASIPAAPCYLRADAALAAAMRVRLDALAQERTAEGARPARVGLVWAGDPGRRVRAMAAVDRRRSIAPEHLAPLFAVPGVRFFSLQKGGPAAPPAFGLIDLMAGIEDFADTAALIGQLDLVISVDTAVAHLAAALGKTVWLMDRHDHCWRWLDGRTDSPWYPGLRITRQERPGDWEGVIAAIARDLRDFAASGHDSLRRDP
jgi:tetratricopeptide (TPR) repeat protein